jgi:hypothetical protein
MNTEYKVIDNFLDPKDFSDVQQIVMGEEMEWSYQEVLNHEQDGDKYIYDSYFAHLVFRNEHFGRHAGITPPHDQVIRTRWLPAFIYIVEKLNANALLRIKCNLYPWSQQLKEHSSHEDYPFEHTGALFSLNTCDGYTKLSDGTKVSSVANRMLLFNAGLKHCSTTTTNAKARFNINFNYF